MNLRADLWDELGQRVEGTFGNLTTDGQPIEPSNFESFRDYIKRVRPSYRFFDHNSTIIDVCQRVADGQLKRVIFNVPPGTSKSETISRLFASYYLYRYPTREVGLVSYGADLARGLAGDAREIYVEGGGVLDPSTSAKNDWGTVSGGGMWGAGFGGPIRGKRFHLGIIDDPHKGPEDLESEVLRKKVPTWWNTTWRNRQNIWFAEGSAIIVVMQRLHVADLVGWLMEQPDHDSWVVVLMDATKSDEPTGLPEGVTIWPDERHVGQLLCPELLSEKQLAEHAQDPDTLEAQFQQRPKPSSGQVFDPNWFSRCTPEQVPPLLRIVEGVDLAVSTKETADRTCAFPIGVSFQGRYYLFRPVLGRLEAPDAQTAVLQRARAVGATMIAVEKVAYQLSFIQHLQRMPERIGISIIGVEADMDKLARARGWSPLARDGLIVLVDDGTGWVEAFLDEVRTFPRKKKDQIDAVGLAFAGIRTIDPGGTPLVGGEQRVEGGSALLHRMGL